MDADIQSKCRGCLENTVDMVSLFESDDSTLLCEKMMRCATVHITKDDGGPTQMCTICLGELFNAIKFREKCELNDKKIRSMLQQLHEKSDITDDADKLFTKTDSFEESKSQERFNIKEEVSNDYDNGYDFFDSALGLKNDFLDGLKIEFDSEEKHHIVTSVRNSKKPKNISDCEDVLLMKRKRRKKKLRKRELRENVKEDVIVPKKRGRKPKLLEYTQDEDIMKVLQNNELQCVVCMKLFPDVKAFRSHAKIHSKTRDHTCDQCGKQFKYKDNLKVHAMTHTGEKPWKCDLCDKSFSKKDNLAIHKKRHLKERNYSCEQCGSSYYTSYELKTHMRVHTGEKPHVCTLCGKRFTAKNNLYIHQRSHTGEKPHVCTVCGKQFTSKNILSIHSRIHTGEKPYICSVCGKRFTANKLAVHMRTHTGEKPHVCPQCGKQFSATNVLVIHMRRHTGEKPYECKLCGQTYGHTQSLNKHMRKQHKMVTNGMQLQMQQINEAHRALLDEKLDPMIGVRETNTSLSPRASSPPCPQIAISVDPTHPNHLSSLDGHASLTHDIILKMT